jgi:hypothetical protein
VFSETRYALGGDLHIAYRATREGTRDIVFVPNWFTNCEAFPELPLLQGWLEAMTSLGRMIFFDQPGTGVSDPIDLGAMPTLEQWADSITAVLDDLGSREAVLLTAAAARVSALAGPNDVLVSSTLRDLVIGSGLQFDDRGTHQLKGVPGEWPLFRSCLHQLGPVPVVLPGEFLGGLGRFT